MQIQSRRTLWSVVLLAFAGAWAARAQPHLVVDLNQESVSLSSPPSPAGGVEHDGVRYFPATDPQHGQEIWRTDGTPDGTFRLTDVCPGRCPSEIHPLGFFGGFLYFLADDSEHGLEIWRTDGTIGSEELFKETCPGSCGIDLTNWYQSGSWIEWRGSLWFVIRVSKFVAPVLWTSDGTPEGTRPFADFCGDLGICGFGHDGSASLFRTDPSGQGLLFSVWKPRDALLVRSDGTGAGTVVLHRFRDARSLVGTAGPLYFQDGSELWTSDGSPSGTRRVRDLMGLVQNPYLDVFSSAGRVIDGVYYVVFDSGEWLRSDGTAEGTVVLARIASPYRPVMAARLGGLIYLLASGEIWHTGGTPETTAKIPGPRGVVLAVVEGRDRLFVLSSVQRAFVWTTDGTAAGTGRVALGEGPFPDDEMSALRDGALITRGGHDLWRIDATAEGAGSIHDFQPANGGSGLFGQVALGRRLLFVAQANPRILRLFASDGTAAGTALVSSAPDLHLQFDQAGSFKVTSSRAGNHAFFDLDRGIVWATDGTRADTRPLRWNGDEVHLFVGYTPMADLGGRLIFSGQTLSLLPHCFMRDLEPWVSGGEPRITQRIVDLSPFGVPGHGSICDTEERSSSPGPGLVLGGVVLFAADDLIHGRELFATDGTKAGTRLVADIDPKLRRNPLRISDLSYGPVWIGRSSDPTDLVRLGSRAFFVATDGETGRELWTTDGRRTRQVVDLIPGPASSAPHDLVAFQGAVYFFAALPGGAEGLFQSDGTARGTTLLSDLPLAGQPVQPKALIATRNRLFFTAASPATGTELWTSEGAPGTTHLIADLRPGPRSSAPQNLKIVGDRVIFAADDGITGLEPWQSDGTPEGTTRLGDLARGFDASSPGPFSVIGRQILFGADDGEHGRELWAIPLADLHE